MAFKFHWINEKGVKEINEDMILAKDGLFAVFDGAGSLDGYKNKEGKTGGRLAAEICKEVFSKNDKSLVELAREANNKLKEGMLKEHIDLTKKDSLWTSTAAVVKLTEDRAEYLQVSDSLIMIIRKDGSHRLIVPYHDHDKETMVMWKNLIKSHDKELFKRALHKQTVKVRGLANVAYGALNGMPEVEKFFNRGEFSTKSLRSIILFTDGLFLPQERPSEEPDWDKFVSLYLEGGLKNVFKFVHELEEKDPECVKYPRFKKHDDATAIGIDFY